MNAGLSAINVGAGADSEGAGNPVNQRVLLWSVLSVAVFQVLMVASTWGQWWTVAALCALNVLRGGCIAGVSSWMKRTGNRGLGGWLLMGINLLISTALSQLLHWNLLAWFNLLFQAIFLNEMAELVRHPSEQRVALGLYLAVSAGLALREGIEASTIALFCTMGWLFYVSVESRYQMLLLALEASRESHRRLRGMQAQLVNQEKLSSLGLLAAGVAHEINNPMAFVTSNVRLLARDMAAEPQLPDALREYVDDVLPATLDGIRRVNSIVADLRRFARDDPGQPSAFDLNAEVGSALRLAQGELKGRCEVRVELGELPLLLGQARQIGQVVLNLIVNAAQAVPAKGGVVTVSTRAEPDEVLVRVRDNGSGMSAEVRDKLFQPFFTTKPAGQGTGLGLAVAYGIITGHGGRIEVESEPGQGSCFTVRLPRASQQRGAAREPTSAPSPSPGAGPASPA